ncbi:MAG: tetratricopeptide repeat protein [Chloroflexi bacterium]|nr:tetratricopeptide repeat protein [Chloroflexota bacterium]
MAEISLRAYQDRIANLAEEERFDEVIAHARHILKRFPKNLRAYEQLGGALFAKGRWAEAADVLRRALGAKPQDFETRLRLAQSYQRIGQNDRAIWHAERALDQMPNDAEATGLIRALYREHRGEEIERLQLTAGALAQQHIRGNLLPEALDTLDSALERNPERLDLRLLRARALWLDGRRMDAAESAIQILEQLPYAIDANRIMTELWLAEQRPSDAQTYLGRIEELDPYMAHQLAAGEPAPDDLLPIDELDYNSISSREHAIVDPEWLKERAGQDSGLGALFGIDETEATEDQLVTADLDDLLSDEQIETLFSELVIGEAVAEVSEATLEDDAEQILPALDEEDLLANAPQEAVADDEDADDLDAIMAQMSLPEQEATEDESDDFSTALDNELASLLEQLDDDSDDSDDGDWMAEIQQGSLELGADDESSKVMEDFDREWVKQPDDEETGGAPWLSAAMREALDKDEDGDFDLFGDDEQLQSLLNKTSDTEPIHHSDIEDWLNAEQNLESSEGEERHLDIEDELLQAPPADSWLDDQDEIAAIAAPAEDDLNRENAALIDSWESELGDDEDDDPYVDWLKDDPNELDDDLGIFAAPADDVDIAAAASLPDTGDAEEQTRAWGLNSPDQLADFVEQGADAAAGSPDWLNAVVPGLDRENDASTDDVNEYARPTAAAGKEFAWVSDIVDEETGELQAVDPAEIDETLYFRFSKPPVWLVNMQAEAAGAAEGITALSIDADIEALELDDLTFDDYFSFDTPTDKMDAINLEDDTQELNFVGLDWDDYFDLESPTEKTIAITLDDSEAHLDFDELGIDDDDFSFAKDSEEAPMPDAGSDLFNDIGLDDEPETNDSPVWLEYNSPVDDSDSDDPDRRSGQSTV